MRSKHLRICRELKAPKGQYNSFGKYSYRSCEDILEAVKPLLEEHGVMLHLSDDVTLVGERHYIVASAWLEDVETGQSTEKVTAFAREDETKKGMDGSQITGTASSYARKYALNALFLIDDTKDADTDEAERQGARVASKKTPAKKPAQEKKAEKKPDGLLESVEAGIKACAKEYDKPEPLVRQIVENEFSTSVRSANEDELAKMKDLLVRIFRGEVEIGEV